VGPGLAVLDPAPAVARHLGEVLEQRGLRSAPPTPPSPQHRFLTTGDAAAFDRAVARLVGADCCSQPLRWAQSPNGEALLPLI